MNKKTENSILLIIIGVLAVLIIVRLLEKERKKKKGDKTSPQPNLQNNNLLNLNNLTALSNNNLNFVSSKNQIVLNKFNSIYENDVEQWYFDVKSQKIIVATDNYSKFLNHISEGFLNYSSCCKTYQSYCVSIDLSEAIKKGIGVVYIDFSAELCAGLGIMSAKSQIGCGIGTDFKNFGFYGNIGSLASFLENKVSTYESSKTWWTSIFGIGASVGGSINYCPYMKDVRDLFGNGYTFDFLFIKLTFSDWQEFRGIGLSYDFWGKTLGYNLTDSFNKGMIFTAKELSMLLTCSNNGYQYEINAENRLVIKTPNSEYLTNIVMIDKRANGYLISKAAEEKYGNGKRK